MENVDFYQFTLFLAQSRQRSWLGECTFLLCYVSSPCIVLNKHNSKFDINTVVPLIDDMVFMRSWPSVASRCGPCRRGAWPCSTRSPRWRQSARTGSPSPRKIACVKWMAHFSPKSDFIGSKLDSRNLLTQKS